MNNDDFGISKLYEAVFQNENRFKGISPEVEAAIKRSEEKVRLARLDIENSDTFFNDRMLKMTTDNPSDMIQYDPRINPSTGNLVTTMYTDGKHFFYNPVFVNKLSVEEVESVILHEVLHVVLGHHIEFSDLPKDRKDLWDLANIAADLALNNLIRNRKGFYMNMLLVGEGNFKHFPPMKDARVYFDLLLKELSEKPKPPEPPDGPKPPPPDGRLPPPEPPDGPTGDPPPDGPEGDGEGPEMPDKLSVGDDVKISDGTYGKITEIKPNGKHIVRPLTPSETAKYTYSGDLD